MKSNKLDKYKRSRIKHNVFSTGISLDLKHRDFLQKNSLNLSRMIRDYLDKLIKESEETGESDSN